MVERSNENAPPPFPRDWLPDPTAPEGAPEWDTRLERIIAAAEPALRDLRSGGSETQVTWSTLLGSWWKPAGATATAAAVLLSLLDAPAAVQDSGAGGLPLSVAAAEGEPSALWQGLGIDADPVLALIALQEQARARLELQGPR